MKKNEPTYYAIIPAEVRYCKSLPFGARIIFGEIMTLANKSGFCWASNEFFSQNFDVHQTTISEWIGLLKKEGFIDFKVGKGNVRKITVLSTIRKKPKQSKEKDLPTDKENHLHNNTSNNNISNIVSSNEVEDFNSTEYFNNWIGCDKEWMAIIGAYAIRKSLDKKFTSKAQCDELIPKFRKTATSLAKFTRAQIKSAFGRCEDMRDRNNQPFPWTLFTVLNEVLK